MTKSVLAALAVALMVPSIAFAGVEEKAAQKGLKFIPGVGAIFIAIDSAEACDRICDENASTTENVIRVTGEVVQQEIEDWLEIGAGILELGRSYYHEND